MTRDDAINMAKKINGDWWLDDIDLFEFTKLVAQHERSLCIQQCREIYDKWVAEEDGVDYPDPLDCIIAIRLRGEA